MKTTHETTGTVKHGAVMLPPDQNLPDGIRVRIVWDEADTPSLQPYDREALTEAEVLADLEWATGKRFAT